MQKIEHTPGPWVIRESAIGTVVGPDQKHGAVAALGAKPHPADARLIAAAPDQCVMGRAAIAKAGGN